MAPEGIAEGLVAELVETADWRTDIKEYLEKGSLLEDNRVAARLRIRASHFCLISGKLFKRGFEVPLLKCLGTVECTQILREVHEG